MVLHRSASDGSPLTYTLPALQLHRAPSPQLHSPCSMSSSMPVLPLITDRITDVGHSLRRVVSPAKLIESPKSELKQTSLPLWSASAGLQQLYSLAGELSTLWDTAGFSDERRQVETEAFAAVASKDLLQRIASCKQYMAELAQRCEALRLEIRGKLNALVGQIKEDFFNALAAELQDAAASPLSSRWRALQKVNAKISLQLERLKEMRQALADAAKVLGLGSLEGADGAAALLEQMRRLRSELFARRAKALQILEEPGQPIQDVEDNPEYLKRLAAEVKGLETRVQALQTDAMKSALNVRKLWEELGQQPQLPRDEHAVRLSADSKLDDIEKGITRSVAEAVKISLSAWQELRANAEEERQRLHKALRAFGVPEDIRNFLAAHGTLHCNDLAACRQKFDEVMAEVHAEERRAKEYLKQLYDETGLGSIAFKGFEDSLDSAESREARRKMLVKETKRLERYLESLTRILGPLRELKELVVAAVTFEASVQAGKMRFAGNSLHFLEEEKFRRRFAQRYPELIEKLIEAISSWEQDENSKFMYHGLEMREGLIKVQGKEVALVRVPGDLSCMSSVVELLHLTDLGPSGHQSHQRNSPCGAETPTHASARNRSSSQPHKRGSPGGGTPTHGSARSHTCLQSRSLSASPPRPRRRRDLPGVSVSPPAPFKCGSPPKPPGYPSVDAVRIASGVRCPPRFSN